MERVEQTKTGTPTIIEHPEQVELLIAGAPLGVTNGVTWPGGRGVSPLSNTAEWLRKCSEMTKASIESHKALALLVQVPCEPLEAIEWINDGKHDLKVEIVAEGKDV